MRLLILLGLFVSSSSFAERTFCPGHLSDADCKKQCSGDGKSYDSGSRACDNSNKLRDFRGKARGQLIKVKDQARSFNE